MAIVITDEEVSVTASYQLLVQERTKNITIDVPIGADPIITVLREIATWQDDVLISEVPYKSFQISIDDLISVDQLPLIQQIADTIDAISPTK